MKLRYENGDKKLVIGTNQNFRTDVGWDESFQAYEREVLEDIINPVENYETCRYIHKPYMSNTIQQSDIWFRFYFKKNNSFTEGLDYFTVGIEQSDINVTHLKSSFFKLEFYKTPNNDQPNRQNRRLVFSKNLNPMVGEEVTLTSGQNMKVPVFMGSPFKNKENMYLFWFEDDTVLEETLLTGGTFYMTAKFYNASNGEKTQFTNQPLSDISIPVEGEDLYYIVEMDRSNAPTYNYMISEYDPTNNARGNRVGTSSSPVLFYQMTDTGALVPTPAPTTPQATPSPTNNNSPTPTPSPMVGAATATWSVGTQVIASTSTIQPDIETITGSVTITNGSMTFTITSTKSFNYGNESTGVLNVSGIGVITATCISGASTQTSYGTLTLPIGTYSYTLTAEIEILGTTSGNAITNIIQN